MFCPTPRWCVFSPYDSISLFCLDLEWSLTYVGSPESTEYDQVLDSILLGPVAVGLNRFVFQVDPPKLEKIPQEEWIGITILFLTCKYRGQLFIRVGYYVSNEYSGTLQYLSPAADEGEDIEMEEEEEEEDLEEEEEEEMSLEWKMVNEATTVLAKIDYSTVDPQLIVRRILADKPRVTHFTIHWMNE